MAEFLALCRWSQHLNIILRTIWVADLVISQFFSFQFFVFWWEAAFRVSKYVLVKLGVIVIFKTHNASFKRLHYSLLILKFSLGNLNTLLHKIRCHYRGFAEQLFVRYDLFYAFRLFFDITLSLYVRVSGAITYFVARFFAALASNCLVCFFFTQRQVISSCIASDVSTEFTTLGSRKLLTTTPPNFPRPLTTVRAARPV
jgi:hypothetical protein